MLAVATAVKFLTYYHIESQEHAKGKNVELELSAFNANNPDLPDTLKLNMTNNPLASNGDGLGSTPQTPKTPGGRAKSIFVDERLSPTGPTKQWMRGDSQKSPLLLKSNKVTVTSNPLHSNPSLEGIGEETVSITIE